MSLKVSYSNSGKGQQWSGAALKRKIVSRTLLPRSKTFRCFVLQVGLYHTWQTGSKQFSVRLAKYFPFKSNEIQPNQIISTFWYRKLRKFWWYFLLNLRHTFTKHFLILPFHDFSYQIHHHKGIVDGFPPLLLTKRHTVSHAELSLFSLVLFLCNLA